MVNERWRLRYADDAPDQLTYHVEDGVISDHTLELAANLRACYTVEHDRQRRLRLWQATRP